MAKMAGYTTHKISKLAEVHVEELGRLAGENAALRQLNAELLEALEPFAQGGFGGYANDSVTKTITVKVGDLRHAAEVYTKTKG